MCTIVYWNLLVCAEWFVTIAFFFQALIPSGSDTLFSYGHKTVNVPLPQSMAALTEVRNDCSLLVPRSMILASYPGSFPLATCWKQPGL